MDVERAMEFIVKNLAAVTAAQQQAEVRAARTDRQIKGMQTLLKVGMRMLVNNQRMLVNNQKRNDAAFAEMNAALAELTAAQKRTDVEIKDLVASQKRTDQKFDRWLDSLKGGNGKRHRS